MGLLDSLKNRVSVNVKLTQLSFLFHPAQIVAFCWDLRSDERTALMKGIESQFRWQPVAQFAQAMFPGYYSNGVSAEALDMVKSGSISGGLELMRQQNQFAPAPSFGMTPAQQASLGFAWVVLKAMDQENSGSVSASQYESAYCTQSGRPAGAGARFCTNCGTAFSR